MVGMWNRLSCNAYTKRWPLEGVQQYEWIQSWHDPRRITQPRHSFLGLTVRRPCCLLKWSICDHRVDRQQEDLGGADKPIEVKQTIKEGLREDFIFSENSPGQRSTPPRQYAPLCCRRGFSCVAPDTG
jgi:hypothetical protein